MSATDPPAADSTIFTGPVDMSLGKPALQVQCAALGMSIRDKQQKQHDKKTLVRLIDTMLFVNFLSWEEDARFAPLYQYRKEHPQKHKKGEKPKRTSAHKATEDLAEQAKSSELTGANLKLLNKKVTTDPPASFSQLSLQVKGGKVKPEHGTNDSGRGQFLGSGDEINLCAPPKCQKLPHAPQLRPRASEAESVATALGSGDGINLCAPSKNLSHPSPLHLRSSEAERVASALGSGDGINPCAPPKDLSHPPPLRPRAPKIKRAARALGSIDGINLMRSPQNAEHIATAPADGIALGGWSNTQFRARAILSGCDYLRSISGIGLETAHTLLRKCKTAEQVLCAVVAMEGKKAIPRKYIQS
ncbi:hypothetical protein DFH09DRAFT_1341694 [Mycena vulgaris]|nr:hypothetical protein DFH09DRAFT_1341694 [Mycena vulgaris]